MTAGSTSGTAGAALAAVESYDLDVTVIRNKTGRYVLDLNWSTGTHSVMLRFDASASSLVAPTSASVPVQSSEMALETGAQGPTPPRS